MRTRLLLSTRAASSSSARGSRRSVGGTLPGVSTALLATAAPRATASSGGQPEESPHRAPATRQSPAPLQLTSWAGTAG
eukprot:CAMPEP_0182876050 /NCGR_PEP_ID=MMETSP0034_2-20130328/13919_1 /TAXON_ID=156128 /ORGANISM="Nephroselmis pyriformis, Strain CCMP717" /LENGTH=78 /DNA_ID=CAMNT_0025008819 /DNA_START=57 /DNA_END=290 /DNA_ORIENTATION=+